MKKQISFALLTVMLIVALVPAVAFADMGPKPSVRISVECDQPFYITLLSQKDYFGPWMSWDGNEEYIPYEVGSKEYDVFKKFASYADADGFVFLQEFEYYPSSHSYVWGYHPPNPFKVLIYFPNEDAFAVSDVQERYAFNSSFVATVDAQSNAITLEQNYSYFAEVLGFFVRFLFTLVMEIGVAFVFGYREQNQIAFITAVNFLTQLALNIFLSCAIHYSGYLMFILGYIFAEFFVFVIEAVVFALFINKVNKQAKKHSVGKTIGYAVVANFVSLCLGFLLSFILSLIPALPI